MTSTVTLVPVDKELHAALLYEWRKNPAISRFMYTAGPATFEEHLSWLALIETDPTHIRFVVQQGDKPVGTAAFLSIASCHRRADFDMYIGDPRARLLGVGAAAELLMLDHGFHNLNLHKISCDVFSENEPAIRMHIRMGFSLEGVLRDHALTDGKWSDVSRLSILDSEWKNSRGKILKFLAKLIPHTTLPKS